MQDRPHADIVRDNLTSIQAHILQEERRHPGASGDFSMIISAISLAGKAIAAKVRRANLEDVLGAFGTTNVQGEGQQKLDVIANEIIMKCLGDRVSIAVLASEEDEEPTILRRGSEGGKYCVLFDPLDGSSNLDCAIPVGTIFTILRNDPTIKGPVETVCQPGRDQVAAGYILYGSATVMVLTTGSGVDMFVLDQSVGSFLLVRRGVRIPRSAKTYSVNEAYASQFPQGYRAFLDEAKGQGFSSRYIGSMVADVHRTLLNGGVFLYPPTAKQPAGKIRMLYEANPLAFIIEQAGGMAYSGLKRTLDLKPSKLHERTPIAMGSPEQVDALLASLRAHGESA
ncbi:MAG: class 1 fructose-bisphosphatase [Phycisphaerales bacterium]|jgi:fructose-1,6-bisphosphatase I